MLIGLDCAEPSLVLERWRDELPTISRAHGARLVRSADVGHPADHRSRLVLHDVVEDARRPRRLRLPQPLRPHVRRRLHRDVDGDQGAAAVGLRHARRRLVDRALRSRLLPAEAAERRHGRLLPHAVARAQVHVPGGAQGRDRGRRRRVPVRHEGLPHGRQGVPPAAGLRDDRPALRARGASRSRRSRGRCSRWSRWAPTACTTASGSTWIPSTASTSRATRTRARSSTTTATSTGSSGSSSSTPTRTPSSSSSPTTARSGSTAASASTSGCGAKGCSRRSPSRTACRRCATSASTGRARRRGARAATTRASSSTSQGREPEGTIPPEEYEAVRDDLARRIAAIPDDAGNPIPTAVYKPEELYGDPQGVAPDLIVVFGDLLWRSVGTIGGDEGDPDARERHRPRRREPRAGRALHRRRPGHRAPPAERDAHLLDIAPDRARASSGSRSRPGCAARACSAASSTLIGRARLSDAGEDARPTDGERA